MSALPPPGTRYVHYSRYSTDHQTFKSIEDQQTLCRAYAERQGWVEVAAYHDAARSGATMVGRAGLFDMLAAADRGEFAVIRSRTWTASAAAPRAPTGCWRRWRPWTSSSAPSATASSTT